MRRVPDSIASSPPVDANHLARRPRGDDRAQITEPDAGPAVRLIGAEHQLAQPRRDAMREHRVEERLVARDVARQHGRLADHEPEDLARQRQLAEASVGLVDRELRHAAQVDLLGVAEPPHDLDRWDRGALARRLADESRERPEPDVVVGVDDARRAVLDATALARFDRRGKLVELVLHRDQLAERIAAQLELVGVHEASLAIDHRID